MSVARLGSHAYLIQPDYLRHAIILQAITFRKVIQVTSLSFHPDLEHSDYYAHIKMSEILRIIIMLYSHVAGAYTFQMHNSWEMYVCERFGISFRVVLVRITTIVSVLNTEQF